MHTKHPKTDENYLRNYEECHEGKPAVIFAQESWVKQKRPPVEGGQASQTQAGGADVYHVQPFLALFPTTAESYGNSQVNGFETTFHL